MNKQTKISTKKVYKFVGDPYSWPILLYIGSWPQFRSYVLRNYGFDFEDQDFEAGMHSILANASVQISVIWLPYNPFEDMEGIRVLSHELLHAAKAILDKCGVTLDEAGEALCYFHENLNKQAHRLLCK